MVRFSLNCPCLIFLAMASMLYFCSGITTEMAPVATPPAAPDCPALLPITSQCCTFMRLRRIPQAVHRLHTNMQDVSNPNGIYHCTRYRCQWFRRIPTVGMPRSLSPWPAEGTVAAYDHKTPSIPFSIQLGNRLFNAFLCFKLGTAGRYRG
jgi:hypothetical protein